MIKSTDVAPTPAAQWAGYVSHILAHWVHPGGDLTIEVPPVTVAHLPPVTPELVVAFTTLALKAKWQVVRFDQDTSQTVQIVLRPAPTPKVTESTSESPLDTKVSGMVQ